MDLSISLLMHQFLPHLSIFLLYLPVFSSTLDYRLNIFFGASYFCFTATREMINFIKGTEEGAMWVLLLDPQLGLLFCL